MLAKGKPLDGRWFYYMPNQIFNSYKGYSSWERTYPDGLGKCETHISVWIDRMSDLFKKNGEDVIKTSDELMQLSHKTNYEDYNNCQLQQRNMETGIFDKGTIHAEMDAGLVFFEKYYKKNNF